MPYATNNDLPDAIKNSLPSEAQTIFRKAFNGASGDDKTRTKIAWAAVKKAGWQKQDDKWAKMAAPKLHDFDAEVFSVGTWNGDKYTEADLDNMVSNFNALTENIKPPVKLGHNDKQKRLWSDGQPALGWVKDLKRVGSKLIATLSNVPEVVYKAIKNGLYKRVSAEIYWNYKHGGNIYSRVLSAVALLGADIPAVSNLEDLQAFLSQSTGDPGSFDRAVAYSFDVDDGGKILTSNSEKEFVLMNEKEYQLKIAKLEADKAEAERKAKAETEARKKYEQKIEAEKLEQTEKNRREAVRTFCEKMVNAGRMLPAQRDMLLSDKHTYSNGDLSIGFETVKSIIEAQGKVIEFKKEYAHDDDETKTYTDPSAELDRRIKELRLKNPKLEYAEATDVVIAADPKLADEWTKGGEA